MIFFWNFFFISHELKEKIYPKKKFKISHWSSKVKTLEVCKISSFTNQTFWVKVSLWEPSFKFLKYYNFVFRESQNNICWKTYHPTKVPIRNLSLLECQWKWKGFPRSIISIIKLFKNRVLSNNLHPLGNFILGKRLEIPPTLPKSEQESNNSKLSKYPISIAIPESQAKFLLTWANISKNWLPSKASLFVFYLLPRSQMQHSLISVKV